ncbi:MAG: hypothetical protein ABSG99_02870 [Sedimentisphaerales bacterium]
MDIQKWYKFIMELILVVSGIVLGVWLVFFVMLYGGIMQALNNWQINNFLVAMGIIRAVCCGAGSIPAYILILIAKILFEA